MKTQKSQAGAIRLTGAGKVLLFLVGLAVLAYAAWLYRDRLPFKLPGAGEPVATPATPAAPSAQPAPQPQPEPGPSGAGGTLARIKQSGVLRVGMEPDAPPLHFINDRKQEDGFDFRLAGVVAEALGAKRVQVVEADYEELPDKL